MAMDQRLGLWRMTSISLRSMVLKLCLRGLAEWLK
jgi:hypothetical protein